MYKIKRMVSLWLCVSILFSTFMTNNILQSSAAGVEHVIINQVYGGSNDGYASHSFIELYNPTSSAVNLNGWSIQYKSSASGPHNDEWQKLNLTGWIGPQNYYLIRCGAVDTQSGSYQVPAGNQEWDIQLHNKGLSVVLVAGTEKLADSFSGDISDRTDYVDCLAAQGNDGKSTQKPPAYESDYDAVQSKKQAVRRSGFADTDDNSADVVTVDYSGTVSAANGPHVGDYNPKQDQILTVSPASIELTVGDTSKITASASTSITYLSGDTSIATVDANGIVRGVRAGTTTVTVTAISDETYNAAAKTVSVIVADVPKTVQSITASADKTILDMGDTGKITVSGNKTAPVTFESSDSEVVYVDSSGNIKAMKTGTAVITISVPSDDAYTSASSTVSITVTSDGAPVPDDSGAYKYHGEYNDRNGGDSGYTDLDASLLGRYDTGYEDADGGVAEIVVYNKVNKFAYLIDGSQGGKIHWVDMRNIGDYSEYLNGIYGDKVAGLNGGNIDVKNSAYYPLSSFTYGDMTSIAVSPDGTRVAVCMQDADFRKGGAVLLFGCNLDGSLYFIDSAVTGVQPDMVTFNGNDMVLTADEGEPRNGYTAGEADPKGSVTVLRIGINGEFDDNNSGIVDFTCFDDTDTNPADPTKDTNPKRANLIEKQIIIKDDSLPSEDFEPEYLAVWGDKAYVVLQENNAIAILDLLTMRYVDIFSVGFEDYSTIPVDIEKGDGEYNPDTYSSVRGIRMPDGITVWGCQGKVYLLTANEGDSRGYGTYSNEYDSKTSPTGKVKTDSKVKWFGDSDKALGTKNEAYLGYDGLDESLDYIFGGRSFTMFEVSSDGNSINEIYSSEDDFESITASCFPDYFNCSNDNETADDRSNKKGPEPESVVTGVINNVTYAFIGIERTGGIMMYDISDPYNVKLANYFNSRDFGGVHTQTSDELEHYDIAPEGLKFVPAGESSTGTPLLLVGNEVSGTMSVIEFKSTESSDIKPDAAIPPTSVTDIYFAECTTPVNMDIKADFCTLIEGGTAYDIDCSANGTVVYDSASKKFVYTSAESGEAFTETVTVTFDNEANNKIVYTINNYKGNDDVYVIDYGLPVELNSKDENGNIDRYNLFYNDKLSIDGEETEVRELGLSSDYLAKGQYSVNNGLSAEINTSEGYGTVTYSPGSYKYTLNKFLDSVDTFYYAIQIVKTGAGSGDTLNSKNATPVMTSKVTIVPANVIYYEDNFSYDSSNNTGTNAIIYSGNDMAIVDSTGLVTQSNNQDNLYGYDEAYTNFINDSLDSSQELTDKDKVEFTFKGTGFDIVARAANTATVLYTVFNSSNKLVNSGIVDTYYNNGSLYQLPVISVKDLDYDTYKVRFIIRASNAGSSFYFDGIRIYNPLKDADAKEYYNTNEYGADIMSVREMVLGNGSATETDILDSEGNVIDTAIVNIPGSKATIIDADGNRGGFVSEDMGTGNAQSTASVLEILHSGPNNEIYLDESSALAFYVTKNADVVKDTDRTLQIEVKSVASGAQSVSAAELELVICGNKLANINTATAMYYNIPLDKCQDVGDGKYLVVISGDSNNGCNLSFTNIKVKGYDITPYEITDSGVSDRIYISKVTVNGSEDISFAAKTVVDFAVTFNSEVTPEDVTEKLTLVANGNPVTIRSIESAGGSTTVYTVKALAANAVGIFTYEFIYDNAITTSVSANVTSSSKR